MDSKIGLKENSNRIYWVVVIIVVILGVICVGLNKRHKQKDFEQSVVKAVLNGNMIEAKNLLQDVGSNKKYKMSEAISSAAYDTMKYWMNKGIKDFDSDELGDAMHIASTLSAVSYRDAHDYFRFILDFDDVIRESYDLKCVEYSKAREKIVKHSELFEAKKILGDLDYAKRSVEGNWRCDTSYLGGFTIADDGTVYNDDGKVSTDVFMVSFEFYETMDVIVPAYVKYPANLATDEISFDFDCQHATNYTADGQILWTYTKD